MRDLALLARNDAVRAEAKLLDFRIASVERAGSSGVPESGGFPLRAARFIDWRPGQGASRAYHNDGENSRRWEAKEMRLLALSALTALTLGLGGCMHGMGGEHHDGMMGGMMGQHASGECPGADEAQHGAGSEVADQAQPQHPAGSAGCPRGNQEETQQHEHGEQPQPN